MHVVNLIDVRDEAAFFATEHGRSALAARRLSNAIVVTVGASLEGDASFVVLWERRKSNGLVRGHKLSPRGFY